MYPDDVDAPWSHVYTPQSISLTQVEDLLTTAFEDGVSDWVGKMCLWDTNKAVNGPVCAERILCAKENSEFSQLRYLHPLLYSDPVGDLRWKIVDSEDEDTSWLLSLEMIKEAAQVMGTSYPRHLKDIIQGGWDAWTADVFLQCCLFKELVYA